MIVDVIKLEIEGNLIPQAYIKSFSVKSSRIERPETLEIELVKKLERYKEFLKEKKKIVLKVCFKDRYPLTKVFDGVITKPNLEQASVKLSCEDFSYLLREPKTVTFVKTHDGEIIKGLAGKFANTSNVQNRQYYRKISFTQKSARWILNQLSEKSLSDWFFIGDKLHYGEKYSFVKEKELPLIDLKAPYIVENKLKWHEGVPNLRTVVVGTDEKGKVHIGKYGKGSNVRKSFDKDAGKEGVQEKAEKLYKELSFKGYKGSLKLLLEPIIFHSEAIGLLDEETLREARIDTVNYSWSPSSGLRQEIFVGQKEKEKKKTKKGRRGRRKKVTVGYRERKR